MYGPILVSVNNLKEAAVAIEAVEAFRQGLSPEAGEALTFDLPRSSLVDQLRRALEIIPTNPVKDAVLRVLLESPEGVWVPYPQIVESVIKSGGVTRDEASGRCQAAIRDLSWQVREAVDGADLARVQRAIELLADRTRTAGVLQYRLTTAGRVAVEAYFRRSEPRLSPES